MAINLGGEDSASLAEARRQANARMEEKNAAARVSPTVNRRSSADSLDTMITKKLLTNSTTGTASLLAKPDVKSLDNPDFIYPGDSIRNNAGRRIKVNRGHIRRLSEFYKRISNGPEIMNRKLKFQFQPEQVIRSVASNTMDMQYFFNQDPAQLTQPVPGQSMYSLELLFNREAELASKKYIVGGETKSANLNLDRRFLEENPEYFIRGDYDPSWVCSLGVLADIMVLDAVIGQGFTSEMADIITGVLGKATSTPSTGDGTKDDTDQTNEQPPIITITDENRNPNLGNTAFITPIPVRIHLAPWMMIEGFVNTSEINFHKFTPNYIPSQAKVFLQVQALYMGFAKETTFFTMTDDKLSMTPPGASSGPDATTVVEDNIELRLQTQAILDKFFNGVENPDANNSNSPGVNLFEFIIKDVPKMRYTLYETDTAKEYRPNNNPQKDIKLSYEIRYEIYWHSYWVNTSNTRIPDETGRSGGTLVKINYDTKEGVAGIPIPELGTRDNPFVVSATGDIRFSNPTRGFDNWVIDDGSNGRIQLDYTPPILTKWPFNEDKFTVKGTVRIFGTRGGAQYESNQRVEERHEGMYAFSGHIGSELTIKTYPPRTRTQ